MAQRAIDPILASPLPLAEDDAFLPDSSQDAGEALLEDIRERPDDDVPRLIYADWLELKGDPESLNHADLIRLQIEVANLRDGIPMTQSQAKRESELLADPKFRSVLDPYEKTCSFVQSRRVADYYPEISCAYRRGFPRFEIAVEGKPRPAGPALAQALADQNCDVRLYAALCLGEVGSEFSGSIPALILALSDPDALVRFQAVWSLSKMGREAVPALAHALTGQNSLIRLHAVGALGNIGTLDTIEPLTRALNDQDHQVRSAASWELGKMNWEI